MTRDESSLEDYDMLAERKKIDAPLTPSPYKIRMSSVILLKTESCTLKQQMEHETSYYG